MLADLALLACLATTLPMTGLIWFVQVVHYPLFARVDREAFGAYHAAHMRLVSAVVMGPMLVELASSLLLVGARPAGVGVALPWVGLASVAAAWASTFFHQVPCHRQLSGGYRDETNRMLVRTNWARVVAWTAHSAVVLAMTAGRWQVQRASVLG